MVYDYIIMFLYSEYDEKGNIFFQARSTYTRSRIKEFERKRAMSGGREKTRIKNFFHEVKIGAVFYVKTQ